MSGEDGLVTPNPYGGKYAAFWRVLLYLMCTPMTLLFSAVLLVGSFLDERTCRRRFLQKCIIAYQQSRVIKHKSR